MKVMYYTNKDIADWDLIPSIIKSTGDEVMLCVEKPTLELIKSNEIDFIVSDRSRYLITQDIIDYLPRKIINLHPSFLPWNKGYYPNYWSIKNGTPHGVTLHYINAGIDGGDIIAQTRLSYTDDDTLTTTYDRCRKFMVELFRLYWEDVRLCRVGSFMQECDAGDIHYKKEFDCVFEKLPNGWDTKVRDIVK